MIQRREKHISVHTVQRYAETKAGLNITKRSVVRIPIQASHVASLATNIPVRTAVSHIIVKLPWKDTKGNLIEQIVAHLIVVVLGATNVGTAKRNSKISGGEPNTRKIAPDQRAPVVDLSEKV